MNAKINDEKIKLARAMFLASCLLRRSLVHQHKVLKMIEKLDKETNKLLKENERMLRNLKPKVRR